MSSDGQLRIKWGRNIAENFNRLSRVHERYRQTDDKETDRQTDGRTMTYIAKVNVTFAKNLYFNVSITSRELQTSRLGLVSADKANVSVSSRSRDVSVSVSSRSRLGLELLRLVPIPAGCTAVRETPFQSSPSHQFIRFPFNWNAVSSSLAWISFKFRPKMV